MQDQTNQDQTSENSNNDALVGLTATIVSAFVGGGQNHVGVTDLPDVIRQVHSTLSGLSGSAAAPQKELVPFTSVKKSVQPDYIVCLEDGKKLKMLKRYIASHFNLTPDQYRAKWGLASDYPMVAPNYAETRRKLAIGIGLGRKRTRSADATGATDTARRSRSSEKSAKSDAPKIDGRSKEGRALKAAAGNSGAKRGRKPKATAKA